MEELDVETANAESTAKLLVLEEYDNTDNMDDDVMNSYLDKKMPIAATIEHHTPDIKFKIDKQF